MTCCLLLAKILWLKVEYLCNQPSIEWESFKFLRTSARPVAGSSSRWRTRKRGPQDCALMLKRRSQNRLLDSSRTDQRPHTSL